MRVSISGSLPQDYFNFQQREYGDHTASLVEILESGVNARLKPVIHQITEEQLRNVDATSDLMMEVRTGTFNI